MPWEVVGADADDRVVAKHPERSEVLGFTTSYRVLAALGHGLDLLRGRLGRQAHPSLETGRQEHQANNKNESYGGSNEPARHRCEEKDQAKGCGSGYQGPSRTRQASHCETGGEHCQCDRGTGALTCGERQVERQNRSRDEHLTEDVGVERPPDPEDLRALLPGDGEACKVVLVRARARLNQRNDGEGSAGQDHRPDRPAKPDRPIEQDDQSDDRHRIPGEVPDVPQAGVEIRREGGGGRVR
jgi:hypothetical protein